MIWLIWSPNFWFIYGFKLVKPIFLPIKGNWHSWEATVTKSGGKGMWNAARKGDKSTRHYQMRSGQMMCHPFSWPTCSYSRSTFSPEITVRKYFRGIKFCQSSKFEAAELNGLVSKLLKQTRTVDFGNSRTMDHSLWWTEVNRFPQICF